jgi:hypothetical protein
VRNWYKDFTLVIHTLQQKIYEVMEMFCVQAVRAKRTAELQYEEAVTRVNELTTINVNLASAKSKVEQELATLAGDYDEVTRELRVC